MELQVGVKVLLRNPEGKFLLMRRSPVKYEGSVAWDIPGGRINPGSPLMRNLKREVKEETSLTLNDNLKLIAAQDLLRNPDRHIVRLTYVGTARGEVVISDEHTGYKWVTFSEMKKQRNLDRYVKTLIRERVIS